MDRFYNCQMNLEIGANMQFGNLTCALSLIWQLQQIQLEICGNTFCIWLCIVPEDQLLHILAGQALLWVSSPIILAFADCNRAIIANKLKLKLGITFETRGKELAFCKVPNHWTFCTTANTIILRFNTQSKMLNIQGRKPFLLDQPS